MANKLEPGCSPVPSMKKSSLPHELRTLMESARRTKFATELFMSKLNLLVFQYSQGFGEILCESEPTVHDEVMNDMAVELDDEVSRYILKLMDFKFKLKNVSTDADISEQVPGNSNLVKDEELARIRQEDAICEHQRSTDNVKEERDDGMSVDQVRINLESVHNPELISIYTDSDVDLTAVDVHDDEVTSTVEDLSSNVQEPDGDSMITEAEGHAEEPRMKCQEPVCAESVVSDDGTEVIGGSPTKPIRTAEVDCAKGSAEDQPGEDAAFSPDIHNPKFLFERPTPSVWSLKHIGSSSSEEIYHTAVLMDTEHLPRANSSSGEYFYTTVEMKPDIRPRSPLLSQPEGDFKSAVELGNGGDEMYPKSSSSAGNEPASVNEALDQVRLAENNKNPRIYLLDEIQVRVERIPQYILDYVEEHGSIWCPDDFFDQEINENDDHDVLLDKDLRRLKSVIVQNGVTKDSSGATRRNDAAKIQNKKCKTRSNNEDITRASSSESEDEDEKDSQCPPIVGNNKVMTVHDDQSSESSSDNSDESRGGELSSDEENRNARKNVLKGLNGPSKATKKEPAAKSVYTPRINVRFPLESDSDDDTGQGRRTSNNARDLQTDDEEGVPSANELVTQALSESDSSPGRAKLPILRLGSKRKRRKLSSSGSSSSSRAGSSSEESVKRLRKKRSGNGSSELKKMILHNKTECSDGEMECRDNKSERSDDKSESSDGDSAEDSEENTERGRKNIRAIMPASKSALDAELAEQKRKKRISERQALFNEEFQMPEQEVLDKLILDAHLVTKERLVEVDRKLVKNLKPHQVEGVRFMWNSCFESVEKFRECPEGDGGCILAHCMGLGKTLQVVALLHSTMSSPRMNIKTALVICPLNTATNWCNELEKWTRDLDKPLVIHEVYAEVTTKGRSKVLQTWQEDGGVCVIHYDLFRNLLHGKRVNEDIKSVVEQCLLDPGPDVVVCDEGHLVKNDKASVTHVLNRIKTKRRIILTGTPLQNNLMEYYCMVQFVKPDILGSKAEYANRFVNPIENGQHSNSDLNDVKLMKARAAVLYRLLQGCVQRRDFSILKPYLPPKYEYAVKIHMSQVQEKLYCHYLKSVKTFHSKKTLRKSFLKHVNYLVQILCHPKALEYVHDRKRSVQNPEFFREINQIWKSICPSNSSENGGGESESEREGDEDVSSNTQTSCAKENSASSGSDDEHNGTTTDLDAPCGTAMDKEEEEMNFDPDIETGQKWWNKFFDEDGGGMDNINLSCKMAVLFEILKLSESIGDKVLVFSQYKYTLDVIEYFLKELDAQVVREDIGSSKRWRKNIEYFRIDGSTAPKKRQKGCHKFNEKTANSRAKVFLISTKAGGLGINLVGANRVVIFDPSWNPSHDVQSIFRAYRFGQTKPCYVYRLLARGTVEEKMYARQVVKLSLAGRVVDQHQIKRHHTAEDIVVMFQYEPASDTDIPEVPEDKLLAELLSNFTLISSYVKHDALLENQVDQVLTEEERLEAWMNYLKERRKPRVSVISSDGKSNKDSDENRPGDEDERKSCSSSKEDSDEGRHGDGNKTESQRHFKEDSDDSSAEDEGERKSCSSSKEDSDDDDSEKAENSSSSDSD